MQFLLERLASPHLPTLGQFDTTPEPTLVAQQIQRIVSAHAISTQQGAMNLLEFGMPYVVDQGVTEHHALERYASRLTRLIEQYEPRLLRPRITLQKTGKALQPYQLVVSGHLLPEAEIEHFYFDVPKP